MSRKLTDDALERVHLQLASVFKSDRSGWAYVRVWNQRENKHEYVAVCYGLDLSCALDELRQRRKSKAGPKRVGPLASALMTMKVGDVINWGPVTHGNMASARKTARRKLKNEGGVWHKRTLPDGRIEIERMPDYSPRHRDYANPAVHALAAMGIGDEIVIQPNVPVHHQMKVHARKKMGKPYASWRMTKLANGKVKVRRVR